MPEENKGTGIAELPEQPKTENQGNPAVQGEQPETKSEQSSEAKSDLFSDKEKLEKSYKEMQAKFTQTTQELAKLKEEANTLNLLRGDPRFVEWATNTYSASPKTQPQAPVQAEDDEEIITTKGELKRLMADEAKKVLTSDPLRKYMEENAVETEMNKVERKGYTDVRNHRQAISDWYASHTDSTLPLEDVYKIVAFEKKVKEGPAVNNTLSEKKAAASEGPGMTVVKTEQPILNFRDAAIAAFRKAGRDTSNL